MAFYSENAYESFSVKIDITKSQEIKSQLYQENQLKEITISWSQVVTRNT